MNRKPRKNPRREHAGMTWHLFALGLDTCTKELETLEEYLSMTKTFLDGKKHRFEEAFREAASDSDFYDANYEEIQRLWHGFPSILIGTTFVAACSCFEASLTDLCTSLQGQAMLTLKVRWEKLDRHEKGVRKAASFLKNNFDVHLSDHTTWAALLDYYRIRNCVVHATGDMELMDAPADFPRILSSYGAYGIRPDSSGRLEIEPRFVEHVVKDMQTFWIALEDALQDNEAVGPVYWP